MMVMFVCGCDAEVRDDEAEDGWTECGREATYLLNPNTGRERYLCPEHAQRYIKANISSREAYEADLAAGLVPVAVDVGGNPVRRADGSLCYESHRPPYDYKRI